MIRFPARAVGRISFPVLSLAVLAGCGDLKWDRPPRPPPEAPPPQRPAAAADVVLADSIAAQTYLADVAPLPLRGFGVVVGLGNRGSSDCPTVVREYLVEYLTKQIAPQGGARRPRLSPEELLDSLDTAVVEVVGDVPPGAPAGMRIDLRVTAIVGSSTQSLEGGLLLPTELRRFDRAASGRGMVQGNVVARAGGPVFVSPFAPADPRTGYVLGGGRVLEARPLRLVLVQPNYQLAQQMERRINERFGQKPRVAEAVSRGLLTLNTPPAYAADPNRFRQVVVRLYLDNRPDFVERKLQDLNRAATAGEVRLEPVAYAWEALGRSAVPRLQPLYGSDDPAVRFYAARAGARLNDAAAVAVLTEIAAARGDPHRLLAVRELGASTSPQATLSLVPLLGDPDQEIRIAAYQALLEHNHPAIRSLPFRCVLDRAQLNCVLDLVECDGPALVYVRRTRAPRLAVFGRQVPVHAPVFYRHPDESVTLVSAAESADVKLFARWGRKLSDEILIPPRVAALISALADLPEPDDAGRLRGLGLPYSRVVQVVAQLCEDGTIPARLVIEQTSLTDILGPEDTPERPETDHEPSPGLRDAPPAPDQPQPPRDAPGRDERRGAEPSREEPLRPARPERDASKGGR